MARRLDVVGPLEACLDYMTQGKSLEDLREHPRDLYADLAGGKIPAARKVEQSWIRHRGKRWRRGWNLRGHRRQHV